MSDSGHEAWVDAIGGLGNSPQAAPMRPFELDATISSLAPGGDGVAHIDLEGERRAVFVPHTAPGDRVRVSIDASRRPARGRLVSLGASGPDRVPPACPWSVRCGGCDWMHLSLDGQRRTHVEHVRAALPASWREVAIASSPAPEALAYRTRARFHVQASSRGRIAVGMHEARSHELVEVDTCAVLHPAVERARRTLSALFDGARGGGEVRMALGVPGPAERLPVLDVQWGGDLPPEVYGRLERAVTERGIAGVEVRTEGATRPARIGDPTPWMVGPDEAPLRLAPGGFGQASEPVNGALAKHVASLVRPWQIDRAVELYAGAGNLSVMLAPAVRELVAVESARDAVDAARVNLAARGLANARVVEADAEAYEWNKATKLVVLDPPRTGARAVATRLASSRVDRVVYVSCDAQTLGRDLAILEATYEPSSIAAFEMFPQTSHVEIVVALERRVRGRS